MVIALWAVEATAAPEAGETMVYDIHHEDHGLVGRHKVSFENDGGDLVVEIESEIKVKGLFVTAFRFEATRRERWRDGKMIAYESQTHDDGTQITVSARAEGDKLIIDGPNGTAQAPLGTFPTHPWNKDIVKSGLLMESKTGKLRKVAIASAGAETLVLDDRSVTTTRYEMTGEMERELWFDEQENWVRLRFVKDGSWITFTLR
jgi:hypothetical protein